MLSQLVVLIVMKYNENGKTITIKASCSTEAYKADDFIEVEEHSHVPLSTADEPKSIPQGCYYSLRGDGE